MIVNRCSTTPLLVLLLAFSCLPILAEQPPWGWTDGRPPGVHRGQGRWLQQQSNNVGDPWYEMNEVTANGKDGRVNIE